MDNEIQKCLGWLAWKAINTVVSLDEQQCMKSDMAYGVAVSHLRERCCMPEDVEIFNDRVIKSATNLDGVDMGTEDNIQASATVATNALQEALNDAKASCSHGEHKLVKGHAEGSTILLASRTMLGECCLAAIQPKGFWTRLRAQERERVCVCVCVCVRERGRIRKYHSRQWG
jgi:hypothetical protein